MLKNYPRQLKVLLTPTQLKMFPQGIFHFIYLHNLSPPKIIPYDRQGSWYICSLTHKDILSYKDILEISTVNMNRSSGGRSN